MLVSIKLKDSLKLSWFTRTNRCSRQHLAAHFYMKHIHWRALN